MGNEVVFFPNGKKVAIISDNEMDVYLYPLMSYVGTYSHECKENILKGSYEVKIVSETGDYLCNTKNIISFRNIFQPTMHHIISEKTPLKNKIIISKDQSLFVCTDERGHSDIDVFKLGKDPSYLYTLERLSKNQLYALNHDKTKVYVAGPSTLWEYDIKEPEKSRLLQTPISDALIMAFTDDNKILYIANGGNNSSIYKYDLQNMTLKGTFNLSRFTHSQVGTSMFLSPDKKVFYVKLASDQKFYAYDNQTFEALGKYSSQDALFSDLNISKGDYSILPAETENIHRETDGAITIRMNGKDQTLYGFLSGEWIIISRDGRYQSSSKEILRYLYTEDENGNFKSVEK
jgi:WD40 repeat protein